MYVLGKNVLVKPSKSISKLVSAVDNGTVISAGTDAINMDVGKNNKVLFGTNFEELELTINGETAVYYFMHVDNIKVVLE